MSRIPNEPSKRIILCCDGTWMDADDGYTKPTIFPYVPVATLQVPSNVTRIQRALKKHGLDGTPQITFYHAGVGTSNSIIDNLTGGLLGLGISENIREVYSFIAANYVPGDEIILIGFSRGAFTVRSVAGMIRNIGLLTREGMADFYPIFKDQENFRSHHYHDIFPDVPFSNKPRGPDAGRDYKRRLEQAGLTRIHDPDGTRIRVQAVAVWDTVGSLGVPQISLFEKLGLPRASKEYKFYDTNLSGNIRHAFQALALDEHRAPFTAAVWERNNLKSCTTDLRQVWFPGAHSNVGGGYDDQEIANITLAWMMDQLASIGVAFLDEYIDQIFAKNVQYYENPPKQHFSLSKIFSRPSTQWGITPIYDKHKPVRPWALGKIYNSKTGIWIPAGTGYRTPGLNVRADPDTGKPTRELMTHTNERIHSCVRVRLELEGLGDDDVGLYKAHALLGKGWRLRRRQIRVEDPIPWNATWGPGAPPPETAGPDDVRWVWEYDGPDEPDERIMIEETLGPYERKLLMLNRGRKAYKKYRKRHKKRHSRNTVSGSKDSPTIVSPTVTSPRSDVRRRRKQNDMDRGQFERDDEGLIDVDLSRRDPAHRRRIRYEESDDGIEEFDGRERSASRRTERTKRESGTYGEILDEKESRGYIEVDGHLGIGTDRGGYRRSVVGSGRGSIEDSRRQSRIVSPERNRSRRGSVSASVSDFMREKEGH